MNDLYLKNIAAFSKRQKLAADFIQGLDTSNYRVVESTSDSPHLSILMKSGWTDYELPTDPRLDAISCIPENLAAKSLILMMGIGLGYLLFETVKKYPNSRILVLEHDGRIFKRALESFDFTPYFENPNIDFTISTKLNNLPTSFYRYFGDNDNDLYLPLVSLVKNDRLVQYSKNYYEQAAKLFTQSVHNYWTIYVGENYRDALKGLGYVLENLHYLDRMMSIEPLRESCKDKIGIVVSSGPSLNNKLGWLRDVQDKALIICADSALKKLLDNDIKPFGVSCLERDDINAELFQGFNIPEDVILFAPPLIKPLTTKTFPGPICTLFRHSYPFPGLPDILPLWNFGLSCSHLSYQVLHFLGCYEIALVGQDLAYDRESGLSHFDGVIDFALQQYAPQKRFMVPDNQGGEIATSQDWLTFRDFYQDLIANNQSDRKVLNVIEPERGLKIQGTTLTDPAGFFDHLKTQNRIAKPPLDLCHEYLKSRVPKFQQDLLMFKSRLVSQFQMLKNAFDELRTLDSVDEYLIHKKELLNSLDKKTLFLFLDMVKPHIKKFEAGAICLWDQREFKNQLPGFIDLMITIVTDVIEVFKK